MLSVAVGEGYGRPFDKVDRDNISTMTILNYASGFMLLLSAAWSKSSFAVTLLRISVGWIKRLIWFVLVTTNAFIGVSAAFQWTQCWPPEKMWKPEIEGTCWPKTTLITYNTFSAGEWLCILGARMPGLTFTVWG